MFDRELFESIDGVLADLEAACGARANVMVDNLPPGEWAKTVAPSADSPVALITVAESAHPFRHVIAAWNAHQMLRKYESKSSDVATLNPVRLAEVEREVVATMRGVPRNKLSGLSRILYDGISKQVRSTINGLIIHRRVQSRHKDCAKQHSGWLDALIKQNEMFFKQIEAVGGQYPKRLVAWNRSLLLVEVLGLCRIAGKSVPEWARKAPEIIPANGLVDSIMMGDADELNDRELTDLACRHAGVPEDWMKWVPAEKAWRGPAAPAPISDTITAAVGVQPSHDEGEYGRLLSEADQLLQAGKYGDASAKYSVLLNMGGNADQRVLVGNALALESGNPAEAERWAKISIQLDPSTDLADKAGILLNRIVGQRLHAHISIRLDVFAYLQAAADFIRKDEHQGQQAWMEAGMLAGSGVTDDGQARYVLKKVSPNPMTGLAVMCWIYAGTMKWASQHIKDLPDFSKEWKLISH